MKWVLFEYHYSNSYLVAWLFACYLLSVENLHRTITIVTAQCVCHNSCTNLKRVYYTLKFNWHYCCLSYVATEMEHWIPVQNSHQFMFTRIYVRTPRWKFTAIHFRVWASSRLNCEINAVYIWTAYKIIKMLRIIIHFANCYYCSTTILYCWI